MPKYRKPTHFSDIVYAEDRDRRTLENLIDLNFKKRDLDYFSDSFTNPTNYNYNRNTLNFLIEATGNASPTCHVADENGKRVGYDEKGNQLPGYQDIISNKLRDLLAYPNLKQNKPVYITFDDSGRVAKFSLKGGAPFEKYLTQKEFAQEMLKKRNVEAPEHPGFFALLRHGLKKLFSLGKSGDAAYEKYQQDVREYDAKCTTYLHDELHLKYNDPDLPMYSEAQEILGKKAQVGDPENQTQEIERSGKIGRENMEKKARAGAKEQIDKLNGDPKNEKIINEIKSAIDNPKVSLNIVGRVSQMQQENILNIENNKNQIPKEDDKVSDLSKSEIIKDIPHL